MTRSSGWFGEKRPFFVRWLSDEGFWKGVAGNLLVAGIVYVCALLGGYLEKPESRFVVVLACIFLVVSVSITFVVPRLVLGSPSASGTRAEKWAIRLLVLAVLYLVPAYALYASVNAD